MFFINFTRVSRRGIVAVRKFEIECGINCVIRLSPERELREENIEIKAAFYYQK